MALTLRTLGVLSVAALLAACGTTPVERAATGAGLGAAVAVATDGSATEGALYGAALGGVGTCLVNPNAQGCY
jgi:hypothetical protein